MYDIWVVWVFLLILVLILHAAGMAIKIRGIYVHSVTLLLGIAWLYGVFGGYGLMGWEVYKYTTLPEFIMRCGVLRWFVYHAVAFAVLFLVNIVFSYTDSRGVIMLAILPFEFLCMIFCLACGVHFLWLPFFYYSVLWLVDWLKSDPHSVGIYGGAGITDALVIKPLALTGMMYLYVNLFDLPYNFHCSDPALAWFYREMFNVMQGKVDTI